jgi:REP-associated tyrosine transposase
MPRRPRSCPAGFVYHIWNRAAGRLRLFKKEADYLAFQRVLLEAHRRHPIRILDWCLMPNHWHFSVYPEDDKQVTEFFRWLTHTHSMRWHTSHAAVGFGPLYQGRFKSLPVQRDEHLTTMLRYIERNPLRAGLVRRALDWRWGSAAIRVHGPEDLRALLSDWPIEVRRDWNRWVDQPQTAAEEQAIRNAIRRSRPFGGEDWTARTARKLQLEHTLRPRGRPKGSA